MPCVWFPSPRLVRILLFGARVGNNIQGVPHRLMCRYWFLLLSAGWVVTYGQNEEALEQTLRSKYGKEIRDIESKREKMSEVYLAAIKNPGSDPRQDERLRQVLRGGRGDVKRQHAIDPQYYGTEEGLEKQRLNQEEIKIHQEEERQRRKRAQKRLKKKKKEAQEGQEEGDKSESESQAEGTTTSTNTKKKAAAAALAAVKEADGQLANKIQSIVDSSSKGEEHQKRKDLSVHMSQIATLTAVAGAAALIGFLVGGGSRRQ